MSHDLQVDRVWSQNPNGVALAVMGRTAKEAARTPTLRAYASRLAARAGPKDYREQLRMVFDFVAGTRANGFQDARWRYVMENGEWVHGTPKSLLGTVLGLHYNRSAECPDPTQCDLEGARLGEKGWGDCDDVATLMAAMVLALGMQPVWHVSHSPAGAHVAVTATTPRGERVELDPVLVPGMGFDQAPSGPGVRHQLFALDGQPLEGFGRNHAMTYTRPFYPNFTPTYSGTGAFGSVYMGSTDPTPADIVPTMLGVMRADRTTGTVSPFQARSRTPHLCAVSANDTRGPRVLAVPEWHAKMFMGGVVWHRTPAMDQFGQAWRYNGDLDAWVPARHVMDREWSPMGLPPGTGAAHWADEQYYGKSRARQRRDRKQRRQSRRRRRRARVKKGLKKAGAVFKKIHRGIQKVTGAILKSKFVQTIVGGVLQVFGVPIMATKKLMAVSGKFLGGGGLGKLLRLARKSPKAAMKFLAESVKASGRSDLLKKFRIPGFGATSMYGDVLKYDMSSYGQDWHAAPVEAIVGLPGVYEMGFGADIQVSNSPEPGTYYRIQKGDNLMALSKKAYGPSNAITHAKWINGSVVNQVYYRPAKTSFESKYIGSQLISFRPQYSSDPGEALDGLSGDRYAVLWIPPAKGVEPPAPDPSADDDDGDVVIPVSPDQGPLGPVPTPVIPEDLDDDDVDDAAPEPTLPDADGIDDELVPDGPVIPADDNAPPADDHDEPAADEGAVNDDVVDDGLVPVPWPDDEAAPANDDGATGTAAAAAGLAALFLFL